MWLVWSVGTLGAVCGMSSWITTSTYHWPNTQAATGSYITMQIITTVLYLTHAVRLDTEPEILSYTQLGGYS